MLKYQIKELTQSEQIDLWLSNWSYRCYIVEKNTNLFIDKSTNLVKVIDRYNSYVYEQKLIEQAHKKS